MTCIAAVTYGKTVWMGGDSAGVSNWDLTIRRDPKVFINGEYLIGFTTSFRMGQLLAFGLKPPAPPDNPDALFGHMVTAFVDSIRDCLKAGGWATKKEDKEEGGCFLVGVRGRLFTIESDYQVGESLARFAAVGCGAAYAMGALDVLVSGDMDYPDRLVTQALQVAENHSVGVRGPFNVLSLTASGDAAHSQHV